MLLGVARIWATVVTGERWAKEAAAGWALDRLPPVHRPALRCARDRYMGGTDAAGELGSGEAAACAGEMIARIGGAGPG